MKAGVFLTVIRTDPTVYGPFESKSIAGYGAVYHFPDGETLQRASDNSDFCVAEFSGPEGDILISVSSEEINELIKGIECSLGEGTFDDLETTKDLLEGLKSALKLTGR